MPARSEIPPQIAAAIRRRRQFSWAMRILFACLIVSAITDRALSRGDDWANFDHRQFTCVAAIDGQTISVTSSASGQPESVYLLGVASCTPHWDDLAHHHLSNCIGQTVCLKLDPTQTRDAQGRLLVYVFIDDRQTINAELVRDGLALADRPNHSTLLVTVEQAEREARSKRRGLWNFVDNWEMPAWRRQWTTQERTLRDRLQSALAAQ